MFAQSSLVCISFHLFPLWSGAFIFRWFYALRSTWSLAPGFIRWYYHFLLRVCFARNSLTYFLREHFFSFSFSVSCFSFSYTVMFSASINCVFLCFISLLMVAAVGESTESFFIYVCFSFLCDNFQQLLFSVQRMWVKVWQIQSMALAYAI